MSAVSRSERRPAAAVQPGPPSLARPRTKFRARLHASAPREKSSLPAAEVWGRRLLVLIVLIWAASFAIGYQASLTILTLVGFALAILAWNKPSIALLGMGILVAIDPMTRVYLLTGGLLRWNTLNYWMMVVILLSIPFILRLRDPHSRLLQAFVLVLALELLITPRLGTGIQDLLSILTIFAMLVYFGRALKEEQDFYWLGIVLGVLAAVGDLVFYLQKDALPYINPNAKVIFPVTALYAILLAFPRAPNRGRIFLMLLAAVNGIWIFLSGSRANMLVGLLCMLFLLFLARSLSWTTFFVVLALSVSAYFSYAFLEDQLYASGRIARLFDTGASLAQRTSGRSDLAQIGWHIFLEHPLGVGTGGFRTYSGESALLDFAERPAHSAWIKVLAENGIPGIIFMAAYVASFAIVGLNSAHRDRRLIGLLVTLAVSSAFLATEFQNKSGLFLAAGAAVFLHQEDFLLNAQIGSKLTRMHRWRLRNLASRSRAGGPLNDPLTQNRPRDE